MGRCMYHIISHSIMKARQREVCLLSSLLACTLQQLASIRLLCVQEGRLKSLLFFLSFFACPSCLISSIYHNATTTTRTRRLTSSSHTCMHIIMCIRSDSRTASQAAKPRD
ncbi:hypothetical protein JOL62DRAFT_138707 [Phyllosticta paracitricarpa]|uniref:Secreted protein n=2 Tax=Phyllosticta TaxID=121621 RepID=A0ABR1ME54_9PEZI